MEGGGKFYEKLRNLAKNSMNLKELGTILGNHENHFGKIIVWGVVINWNAWKIFPKSEITPSTIRDGRVNAQKWQPDFSGKFSFSQKWEKGSKNGQNLTFFYFYAK